MIAETVKLAFNNEFQGYMETGNGKVEIAKKAMHPYNLLFGALGSCLYATFLDIVYKKRLTFDGVDMEVSGSHKDTPPTTLEKVFIKFIIKNPSNQAQFQRSIELAAKYCTIHETISRVATINTEVEFK